MRLSAVADAGPQPMVERWGEWARMPRGRSERIDEAGDDSSHSVRSRAHSRGRSGRHHDASPHPGRKSGLAAGDAEHGEGARRRALLVQPAMRLGDLSAWSVPGQSPTSHPEGPLGSSVHTEQSMCERPVLGQSWRQALQVKVSVKRKEIECCCDSEIADVPRSSLWSRWLCRSPPMGSVPVPGVPAP